MDEQQRIALNLEHFIHGGNWTSVGLREQLRDIPYEIVLNKPENLDLTIAAISHHIGYYATGISRVLDGHPLTSKDRYSFDHPVITSKDEWVEFRLAIVKEFQGLVPKIKNLDPQLINAPFTRKEYGSYARNLWGLIEHSHYHLGQIVLYKKLLLPNLKEPQKPATIS